MQNFQLLGLFAAFITMAAFFLPCYHAVKTKQCDFFSTFQLLALFAASLLWVAYGIRDSSPAIVLLSVFIFAITTILLAQKRNAQRSTS